MGARRARNTTAQQWRHETLDLDNGDRIFWTVDDNHRRGPTILAVASQKHGPYWVPEGRDAIKAAGHPDGQLRAMHDD
jgi:hypothetical protein